MTNTTRQRRFEQPTPLEVEMYMRRARALRSQAMAQAAASFGDRIARRLRALRAARPAAGEPCLSC